MLKRVTIFCCLLTAALAMAQIAPDLPQKPQSGPVDAAKRTTARQTAQLLNDALFRDMLATRFANTDRAPLGVLLRAYQAEGGAELAAVDSIFEQDLAVRRFKGTERHSGGVMELRLFRGEASDGPLDWTSILVAFEPPGEDADYDVIEAFDRDGRIHLLDAWTAPGEPVLIADLDAREDLRAGIALANEMLRAAGLQSEPTAAPAGAAKACSGVETAKVSNIRLDDDQEPWIKGAAEVYAFVSGIDPNAADPEITLVDMPYLDHDGTTYYPNQVLIFWSNYRYRAVNVNFYEHDDGTNYQSLVSAVISGVSTILGAFAPQYAVIAQVANAIIQAMPGSWFTDDDDYVDVIYTIDQDEIPGSGRVYNGASGNVRMTLVPYCLN